MLSVKNLSHVYNSQKPLVFPDLRVESNGRFLILGQSGSGKTTLLHLVAGLIKSQQGEIKINDQEITTFSETKMDRFRGRNIGLVFQKSRLINALSVYDNLRICQFFNQINDKDTIDRKLNELGLYNKKTRMPNSLSQGEQQRLSIARALINQPSVILADEPTASLDDANAGKVISLLMEQSLKNKATLLIATHDQRVKVHFDQKVMLI